MPRKTYAEFTPQEKKRFIERNALYIKKLYVPIKLQFHVTYDADIIDRINQQTSKTDYIRRLIRADIAKETEEKDAK